MTPTASPGPLQRSPGLASEAIQIASRLRLCLSPEAVYLFGSHARGDATFDSDFDFLVVVSDSSASRFERNVAARGLVSDIRVPKDVLVLTRREWDADLEVPCSLARTVLREGIKLHG